MNDIFMNFFNQNSYRLENASNEQILLYQKAYKAFKIKNTKSEANIKLNLESNTIEMNDFNGLEMYKFGYEVAKAE